jgi:hypothetical protein
MALNTTQQEILRHGIRWASNMIAELSGNYVRHLPKTARANLRTALNCLHEAEREISMLEVTK